MPFNKISSMPILANSHESSESMQNNYPESARKRLPVLLSEDSTNSDNAESESIKSRLLAANSEANLLSRIQISRNNKVQNDVNVSRNGSPLTIISHSPKDLSYDVSEVQSVNGDNKVPDDVNGSLVLDNSSSISNPSNILSLLGNDVIEVQSLEGAPERAKSEHIPNGVPSFTERILTRQGSIEETEDVVNNINEKLSNGILNKKPSPAASYKSNESQNSKAEFYIGDYDNSTVNMSPYLATKEESESLFSKKTPRRVQITDGGKGSPKRKAPEFTPPDGGYGWVIAFSACIINAFNIGIIKSYGVLYVAIAKKFPEASAYQTSWLPVFLSTIGLLIAPLIGFLCRKFTSRKVSFVGSIISFLGLLLGAYARSMTELILSFGLLTGLGNGLTSTPGVLITSLYFEERRGLASAICVSGNAIGGFLFPPLISYLLGEYDFEGAMLILSAMVLNMCAASLLYRPIRVHALIQQRKRRNQIHAYQDSNQEKNIIEEMGTSSPALFKSASLRRRVTRTRMISECSTVEDDELHRQVSFMRSSSIMSSIPDLNHYARSWNINNTPMPAPPPQSYYNPPPVLSRQSSRRYSIIGSKLSLSNITNIVAERATHDLDKGAVTWVSAIDRVKHVNSQNSLRSMNMGSTDSKRHSLSRQVSRPYSERPISPLHPIHDEETELDLVADDIVENLLNQSIASTADTNMNIHPQTPGSKVFTVRLPSESREEEDEEPEEEQSQICHACCSFFDCSLMKNHKFLLMALTVMMFAAGAPHAIFFLPAYATDIGLENAKVISLLSFSSIIDLFGRLGVGFFADLKLVNNSVIYGASAAMAGLSIFLIPLLESYIGMGICVGIYGFGVGAWFVMIPTILAKNHGAQRLSASFGLVRMFQGFMNFASPQICGLLIDASKSFRSTYIYMGSCMLLSGLIMMMEPLISKSTCLKNRQSY